MRALDLPRTGTLSTEELCRHVGALRGRPVWVTSLPLPGAPQGLLVSTGTRDYIFVEEHLVPVHRQQVVLHEIGHILCEHEPSRLLAPDAVPALLPSLEPGVVRRVLAREHADTTAELEAELVGSLIGQRISVRAAPPDPRVPPEVRDIAERLAALGVPEIRKVW